MTPAKGTSRRDYLKLMAAGTGLAATAPASWAQEAVKKTMTADPQAPRLRGLVALQQSERQVEMGFPGIGIQMHGRFKGGNRARYLRLLPKICAQGVVGAGRRVHLDRLFEFRRATARDGILRGQVLAISGENKGRERQPSQSFRKIPSHHSHSQIRLNRSQS